MFNLITGRGKSIETSVNPIFEEKIVIFPAAVVVEYVPGIVLCQRNANIC